MRPRTEWRPPKSLSKNLCRPLPACLATLGLGLRVEVSTNTIDLSPKPRATNPLAEGSTQVLGQAPSVLRQKYLYI